MYKNGSRSEHRIQNAEFALYKSFNANCPRMSEGSRELMDKDITDLELLAALKSCSDLAPGSDGISYSVYKKLWVITGAFILDAWNYL